MSAAAKRRADAERRADGGRRREAPGCREGDPAEKVERRARLAAERAKRVEQVGEAAARVAPALVQRDAAPIAAIPSSTKSGQSGIAPVAEPAMTSDGEHQRARHTERGERAAGRPQPLAVRQRAGEEPERTRVAGARRDERVHERADAVARARAPEREPSAAHPDRREPRARAAEHREQEAGAGEPEPGRARARRASRPPRRPASRAAEESPRGQRARRAGPPAAARPRLPARSMISCNVVPTVLVSAKTPRVLSGWCVTSGTCVARSQQGTR